jgi:hypothetical protein
MYEPSAIFVILAASAACNGAELGGGADRDWGHQTIRYYTLKPTPPLNDDTLKPTPPLDTRIEAASGGRRR